MPDPTDLDHLLRDVARQDVGAFRALYDRTAGGLLAVTLRICRQRQLAEDVLQEVYVQIWQRAASFDPARSSARTWMTVIARNRAIDHVRRRARPDAEGSALSDTPVEDLPSLSGDVELANELRALAACLQSLPDHQREAILRAYYEGWERTELAAHFQAPVNTVKTWLRRGLISLRKCMDGGRT